MGCTRAPGLRCPGRAYFRERSWQSCSAENVVLGERERVDHVFVRGTVSNASKKALLVPEGRQPHAALDARWEPPEGGCSLRRWLNPILAD